MNLKTSKKNRLQTEHDFQIIKLSRDGVICVKTFRLILYLINFYLGILLRVLYLYIYNIKLNITY